MPLTVTGTDGVAYHLWQLPELSAPEPEDTQSFTTLDNEMSEGYRTTSLFGEQTGVREWRLTFPTLAASSVIPAAVTDPYGATVSREQYVRNVYKYSKTTGIPFVYSDPNHNGQYYLVDAVSDELTMKKMKGVGIYESELIFRQRRLPGVSVFDAAKIGPYSSLHWYNETSHGAGVWNDKNTGSPLNLSATGDVVFSSNTYDGKVTVRLSGTATTGGLLVATSQNVRDAIIVMKVRESTFSTNGSIVHPQGSVSTGIMIFKGLAATANVEATVSQNVDTWYNAQQFPTTGQATIPMNEFVMLQATNFDFQTSVTTPLFWGIGYKIDSGSQFVKMDIAELWLSTTPMSRRDAYEASQHLRTKWQLA